MMLGTVAFESMQYCAWLMMSFAGSQAGVIAARGGSNDSPLTSP